MDSGGCPLPIESLIKKALILEASGRGGSRVRSLVSGGWPLPIESLIKKALVLRLPAWAAPGPDSWLQAGGRLRLKG